MILTLLKKNLLLFETARNVALKKKVFTKVALIRSGNK